jgi:hypothetical protein
MNPVTDFAMRPQAHGCASMLLMAIAAPTAFAQAPALGTPTARHLGDHPAVVVQRLQRTVGYDYTSKFYPHPAWLYLLRDAPGEVERMHLAARAAVIDTTPDDEIAHGPIARR